MKLDHLALDQGRPSLFKRVFRAGGWTVFGYGTNQFLRLAGNLILTRLLFPEAFGLMAIVNAVLVGVNLLTDVGIQQAIIHNKRGNEPSFLNTAWTLQVVRGLMIWIMLCLLSAPLSFFYGESMLAELLPVVALTAVIGGLGSTKIATANRSLGLARVVILEVGSYAFGLIVTVCWAWVDRSVWSLVIGSIVGVSVRTIASHVWFDGVRNRIAWEPRSVTTLLTFGRWIFVSSALTFLTGEGNRLLLGSFLDVRMLSFFTLAIAIDQFPRNITLQFSSQVLFPAYAEVLRERPGDLYTALLKGRLIQVVPYWLVSVALAIWGSNLMGILYDERYADSGWMLQILALGSLVAAVGNSYNGVLWAMGLVAWNAGLQAIQFVAIVTAVLIGWRLNGAPGVVIGIASVGWVMYPVNALIYSRLALWQPKVDLPFIGASFLLLVYVLGKGFLK